MHEKNEHGLRTANSTAIAQRAIVAIGVMVLLGFVYALASDNRRAAHLQDGPQNIVTKNASSAEVGNISDPQTVNIIGNAPVAPQSKRKAATQVPAAQQAIAAPAIAQPVVTGDWSLPQSYAGKIVAARVRYFPKKLLALTFDDGPDAQVTPQILDTLKQHNAHATFFILGAAAKRHPELVRRIVDEGHAIGNHSFSHAKRFSAAEARNELHDTAAIIEQSGGYPTKLFRPPYGLTESGYSQLALAEGYTGFLWTISSADSRPISAEVIAKNVAYTPNPGDIVLMHDGPGHKATADALPLILAKLEKDGFEFVGLPHLLREWDAWQAASQ